MRPVQLLNKQTAQTADGHRQAQSGPHGNRTCARKHRNFPHRRTRRSGPAGMRSCGGSRVVMGRCGGAQPDLARFPWKRNSRLYLLSPARQGKHQGGVVTM
ncbi:hypothetical protein SKAU_G00331260 [Synaphobranchus kaupii]|uniref:Uncharacterized protein n=1 Tax=Synaphobranchus kaupii TaxID=118154 RepID=A0A9Q1EL68_SYNKA|nr:hypothetical protein SKAU_G00331260 [Synaphobranchus kaupii]